MTNDTLSFVVNARFLTRPASGVDRVAIELIVALAARRDVGRLILLHPVCDTLHCGWLDDLPNLIRDKIQLQPKGRWQGHLWEQLDLPRTLPDQILLSLCSTGPVLRRNQAVMIHDAQVWDVPQSYSRAFRLAYRLLLPLLARRARHLLTVSPFSAGQLVRHGIAPHGKPRIVLNGADHILRVSPDPGTLRRHGLATRGYILAIGNLAPHKNLALLVRAAAARGPDAPELIVAGGMNSKVFADAVLREANGVRFIGRVSDAELRALYEGALAMAFPSLTEGFGLPPLEAMLCGCPVIATSGGAVPDICGEAALFVYPTDQEGWTAALERVAQDAELRENLSQKGYTQSARFTWEEAASSFIHAVSQDTGYS
jgi:glycosyltransferase involved in cell wall biosynthesis